MTEAHISSRLHPSLAQKPPSLGPRPLYSSPQDVILDSSLTMAQKRSILASWASDARAVADAPALRQLDSGAVVSIQDILGALQGLDGLEHLKPGRPTARNASRRRHSLHLLRWLPSELRGRRTDDDDDDPPPCPAVIAPMPVLPPFAAGAELEAA